MLIEAFNIDGFGILGNVSLRGLSPQLNIFYGHNEAGKSTCLEFFRVMLTGYPEKSQSAKRSFAPIRGGKPGGDLTLICKKDPHQLTIARSPAEFGGSRLYNAAGSPIPTEILSDIMGGINQDIYRRVFGFSLEELQRWDKKNEESIRNALYGASFGAGLLPPGEAIREIQRRKGRIFKPRGASQPVPMLLKELGAIKSRIHELQEENTAYDSLMEQMSIEQLALDKGRASRNLLENERLSIERRLLYWEQWKQWRILAERLANIPQTPEKFPENAVERLAALVSTKENREQNLAAIRKKLEVIEERLATIQVDEDYAQALPKMRRLAERKNDYRQALAKLTYLVAEIVRVEKELADGLGQLGPNWSCEKIRQTDRSLFAREDIEKAAQEMNADLLAHQVAANSMAGIARNVEELGLALNEAEKDLQNLPEPPALLSGSERDALRERYGKLEQDKNLICAQQRALDMGRRNFERAAEHACLFESGANLTDEKKFVIIEDLLSRRSSAEKLVQEIMRESKTADDIQRRLALAQEKYDSLISQKENLTAASIVGGGSDREDIEEKTQALRSLRHILASIENEEERKKELDSRIARENTETPVKNWTGIVFGIFFLALSVAIFSAHWFWNLQEIKFGTDMRLPLNLWAAYLPLFCGVILMASAYSSQGPEKRRRKEEINRLLASSEGCSMRLADLLTKSQHLCQAAGMDNLDPFALDAMEMLLERQKEQLLQNEQIQRQLSVLSGDLVKAQSELALLKNDSRASEMRAQQYRRKWHALMQTVESTTVPTPESAETLFSRAEAAKLAYENVREHLEELAKLTAKMQGHKKDLCDMPIWVEIGENPQTMEELERAITRIFAMCSDADAIREERKHIGLRIENINSSLMRAQTRQNEATSELEKCAETLAASRSKWTGYLENLGLAVNLAPETVRTAYKIMQSCLDHEEQLNGLKNDLANAEAEKEDFETSLNGIRASLPNQDAEWKEYDYITFLDVILEHASENNRNQERREIMERERASRQEEADACGAALAKAKEALDELLAKGQCSDAEEFLRANSIISEKNDINRRMEELKSIFLTAVDIDDFDDFIASFNMEDEPGLKAKLISLNEKMLDFEKEEKQIAMRLGSFQERVSNLARGNELETLRQQENALIERLSSMAEEWGSLALAESLLREARKIFEKEKQPEIIRIASNIFANITGNRWAGISLDLENSSLFILPPHGEPVSPINLSRGAQEQAYLSLRLAYIQQHGKTNESLPLIMDEVLVNFDPERAMRTAKAFGDLTANYSQQILYFTCQPNTVDILKNAFGEANIYLVENGAIQAA